MSDVGNNSMLLIRQQGVGPRRQIAAFHINRQDSMATPGNFQFRGGGSQALGPGPDQIFLGITRAPPSAPGRGRAQSQLCGETRTPRPQSTRQQRAALAVKFPIPAKHRRSVSVWVALSLLNFKAPHLILGPPNGRSSPAGSVEGESVGTKLGGSQ
jgi:hypothetical protein